MIWFRCQKCGKTHGRPESSTGTLVFCECGAGTTVPWESQAAPPDVPVLPSYVPAGPELKPLQFASEPITGGPPASTTPPSGPAWERERPASGNTYGYDDDDGDRYARRGRGEKRDPEFCLNHQRRNREESCADCAEPFCAGCVTRFQGYSLCGPCKNFRIRRHELPASSSTMAHASVIMSLLIGSLMTCLLMVSPQSTPIQVMGYLTLVPHLLALGLGIWALRDAEREGKGGGQWLAMCGIGIASIACALIFLLPMFTSRLMI